MIYNIQCTKCGHIITNKEFDKCGYIRLCPKCGGKLREKIINREEQENGSNSSDQLFKK